METLFLTIMLLSNAIDIEVAHSYRQRAMGMMYRSHWEPIEAMLFIHDYPGEVSYWMKNTQLNMYMLFLDNDLELKEIHYPDPFSTETVSSETKDIRYVLEVDPEYLTLITNHYDRFQTQLERELEENEELLE